MSHASSACLLCARVGGESGPMTRVADLPETIVFLNDQQGCAGWCVLVLREHAEHLGALAIERQHRIFGEVARVAGAIRAAFPTSGVGGGPPRINYECLGNLTPHIHWHVIPRHGDDPEPRAAVWGWPAERLRGAMGEGERAGLAAILRAALV